MLTQQLGGGGAVASRVVHTRRCTKLTLRDATKSNSQRHSPPWHSAPTMPVSCKALANLAS